MLWICDIPIKHVEKWMNYLGFTVFTFFGFVFTLNSMTFTGCLGPTFAFSIGFLTGFPIVVLGFLYFLYSTYINPLIKIIVAKIRIPNQKKLCNLNLQSPGQLRLFSPEYVFEELENNISDLTKYTGLNEKQVKDIIKELRKFINIIDISRYKEFKATHREYRDS